MNPIPQTAQWKGYWSACRDWSFPFLLNCRSIIGRRESEIATLSLVVGMNAFFMFFEGRFYFESYSANGTAEGLLVSVLRHMFHQLSRRLTDFGANPALMLRIRGVDLEVTVPAPWVLEEMK